MKSAVNISQLHADASKCVRRAEQEGAVTVSRHGRAVAFLISRDRLEAILETLELMANPKAMAAMHTATASRGCILRTSQGVYSVLRNAPTPHPPFIQPYPTAPPCKMRSLSGAVITCCVSIAPRNSAQVIPTNFK